NAFHTISGKVRSKHGIPSHGVRFPGVSQRRRVDDKHRKMRFPVCLKHLPSSRNQAFPFVCFVARPAGIRANQMRAAHETRRHPPARKTVELRQTSPDKDTIVRVRLLDDTLNNREKIQRLRAHYKGIDEKTYRWQGHCTHNACSDPSPARLL